MRLAILFACSMAIVLPVATTYAAVIHDGSDANGLAIFGSTGNKSSDGSYLTLDSLAHAGWYATAADDRPSSVNYTVSASGRAGSGGRFGVIGLIDLNDENSGVAVLFKPTEGFRVECGLGAFGVVGLHNSLGTEKATTGDTRLATPGSYDPDAWATFTLAFADPTGTQEANMTARSRTALAQVAVTVTQGVNDWVLGTFVIEDINGSPDGWGVSSPDAADHRVGFYVRGAALQYNALFDDLTLSTPEPATCAMLVFGAAGIASLIRRRRK